jgi:transketolase
VVTARVAVEHAAKLGWERIVGVTGAIVGLETFGVSVPPKALATKFGFTPESVTRVAKEQMAAPSAPDNLTLSPCSSNCLASLTLACLVW